ncbi:MAG: PP2C family protein-serine/threonine phosphatase [Butyrivibrio sp.]|nr:PP2C family protein-serine/threonine phosphatase [Butyrivibrio sp.]
MTAVVSLLSFVSTLLMAVENESETAYTRSYNVAEILRRYPYYPFAVEYWTEHIDEIKEITSGDSNSDELMNAGLKLLDKYGAAKLDDLSEEAIRSMTKEEQKTLALMTYHEVSEYLRVINHMQKATLDGPLLVGVSEDEKMIMLARMGKSSFKVGDEINFSDSYFLNLYAGAKSDLSYSEKNIVIIPIKNKKTYTAVAYPVEKDGKTIAIALTGAIDNYIKHVSFNQTRRILLSIVIIALVSGILLLYMLYKELINPIEKIQVGVQTYTRDFNTGELVEEMSYIKNRNEIGRLADDIGVMAERIKEYSEEKTKLASEKARISSEITLAASIQKSAMPVDFPSADTERRYEIYASMKPAKAVGGDFYDFFMIDDDNLALLIADVSDKGVGAAMFMMKSKSIIANNVSLEKSPARALKDSNISLIKNNDEAMFVTVWLGILQLSTGRLVACNAGHERPVLRHGDDGFRLFNDEHCNFLGGFESAVYEDYELQLDPGDKLFLLTDGVPDASDEEANRFGFDGIIETLNKDPDASPKQIIENISNNLMAFVNGAEQFDDITMLALEYKENVNQ